MIDGSDTSRRSDNGRRPMSNPLYAHAYSSFAQQKQQHRYPPLPQHRHPSIDYSNNNGNDDGGYGGGDGVGCAAAVYGDGTQTAASIQKEETQRKRVRSVLLLSVLAFVGMVVLDGLVQFTPNFSERVDERVNKAVEGAVEGAMELERELFERRIIENGQNLPIGDSNTVKEQKSNGGFLRRLMNSLLDDTSSSASPPPHRSYPNEIVDPSEQEDVQQENNGGERRIAFYGGERTWVLEHNPQQPARTLHTQLHTLPLLPKHALQHRQRRELMDRQLPLPDHLMEGAEDEMYHVDNAHRRRRMYPMLHDNGEEVIDARHLQQDTDTTAPQSFETGALYQGYGTHYIDIWVGTPPQRQTVIIDTGSSMTAFPCTGCDSCGTNPTTGKQYHLDEDFNVEGSRSYEEKECKRGSARIENGKRVDSGVPCDLGTCTTVGTGPGASHHSCQMAVAYAEGSTWTALEGSDVVYPAGPHNVALETRQNRIANGVGAGMGNYYLDEIVSDINKKDEEEISKKKENEFDWMDFRLKFGCQKKVTGLFRTQLEDGIMGMDNRKGAFWLQLHEHYKHHGYALDRSNADSISDFDPAQFSLCYDRQPLSMDLRPGAGSGALTLGGTDPLLHLTDMVFAENISPSSGWYNVRIKAMFLRTMGGTLSEPSPQANTNLVKYLRVKTNDDILNGNSNKLKGVIIDSGTTDSYLPADLKAPFEEAWKLALGIDANANNAYHNNLRELTLDEVKSLPTIMIVLKGHAPSNSDKNAAIGMASSHKDMFLQEQKASNNGLEPVSKSDVVIAIPPSHYMEESHREPGKYTARIYFTERFGGQSILGSNILMGHEVLFDNGRGRIGFAESHCDYGRYVEERDALSLQQQEQEPQLQNEEEPVARQNKDERNNGENAELPQNMENDLAASGWARRLE